MYDYSGRDWEFTETSTPIRSRSPTNSYANGGNIGFNMPFFAPRPLQTFHGYAHEDPSRFLSEFTSYVVLQGLEGRDAQIIAGLHLHLGGPALTWFNQLSTTTKDTWKQLQKTFELQYMSTDPQSNPQLIADNELYNTITLKFDQPIEDFHSTLVQKGKRLRKSDVDIMNRFIDGLPDQLKLYVRTGRPTTLHEALSQAKMGEAYKLRYSPFPFVPPPTPVQPSVPSPIVQAAAISQQVDTNASLTNRLDVLESKISSLISNIHVSKPPHESTQGVPHLNNTSNKRPCYKCRGLGHIKVNCKWNGTGTSNPEVQCQLCNQFGHSARTCAGN